MVHGATTALEDTEYLFFCDGPVLFFDKDEFHRLSRLGAGLAHAAAGGASKPPNDPAGRRSSRRGRGASPPAGAACRQRLAARHAVQGLDDRRHRSPSPYRRHHGARLGLRPAAFTALMADIQARRKEGLSRIEETRQRLDGLGGPRLLERWQRRSSTSAPCCRKAGGHAPEMVRPRHGTAHVRDRAPDGDLVACPGNLRSSGRRAARRLAAAAQHRRDRRAHLRLGLSQPRPAGTVPHAPRAPRRRRSARPGNGTTRRRRSRARRCARLLPGRHADPQRRRHGAVRRGRAGPPLDEHRPVLRRPARDPAAPGTRQMQQRGHDGPHAPTDPLRHRLEQPQAHRRARQGPARRR